MYTRNCFQTKSVRITQAVNPNVLTTSDWFILKAPTGNARVAVGGWQRQGCYYAEMAANLLYTLASCE